LQPNEYHKTLIENVIYRINENCRMIDRVFENLEAGDIWKRPNAASNSVGNLILHLCGNMQQYVAVTLGGQPDTRQRAEEFAATEGHDKTALQQHLWQTVENAKNVLLQLDETTLLKTYNVQIFSLSGVGALLHAVEHFSFHTGQLVFWCKLLKNQDLKLYEVD
jgi:uncharacterized damage-inducible protein DinB